MIHGQPPAAPGASGNAAYIRSSNNGDRGNTSAKPLTVQGPTNLISSGFPTTADESEVPQRLNEDLLPGQMSQEKAAAENTGQYGGLHGSEEEAHRLGIWDGVH